jgi:uncharacterized protein
MSLSPLPEYVDTRKGFNATGSVCGEIALSRLARVTSCVVTDEACITADLRFWIDEFGRKRITGQVQAQLQVQCQRCLEPLSIAVADEVNLMLVADEAAAKSLEEEFDPWINEDHKIVIADLVDEPLVLALPIVSFHQTGPCSERGMYSTGAEVGDEVKRSNPFAVLASFQTDAKSNESNNE